MPGVNAMPTDANPGPHQHQTAGGPPAPGLCALLTGIAIGAGSVLLILLAFRIL
jgi:hypothetical protein